MRRERTQRLWDSTVISDLKQLGSGVDIAIDAWVLQSPSVAVGGDGSVRVAYEATDLSGGVTVIDPTKGRCAAGKDMTLSRMAVLPSSS
jgi:hypothetical protein